MLTQLLQNSRMKLTSKLIPEPIMIAMAALAVMAISSCSTPQRNLPIGVFDSGTGGFTVLEKILAQEGLANEDFQYLADQANMPYGRYDAEGKADFLRDLAVKDAFFLTGEGYFRDSESIVPDCAKNRVKIVVIGCNTATAYGLQAIRDTLNALGNDTHVIGVVGAGVRGTVEKLEEMGYERASIGVLATPGTISSNVYERTILQETDGRMTVQVVNQGGYGFAESVDEEKEFVDRSLTGFSENYRGPVLGTSDADIDPAILDLYNFDYSDGKAFLETAVDGTPVRIQINSPDNYARFNLVNLLVKAGAEALDEPLRCIILGCTHYPFQQETLASQLGFVRNYTAADGSHPYEKVIAEDCVFIDPALNTAVECYEALKEMKLLTRKHKPGRLSAYISVPSAHLPDSCLAADGGLSYAFKYGREINDGTLTTVNVPMSEKTVNSDNLERIERLLPLCWEKLSQ